MKNTFSSMSAFCQALGFEHCSFGKGAIDVPGTNYTIISLKGGCNAGWTNEFHPIPSGEVCIWSHKDVAVVAAEQRKYEVREGRRYLFLYKDDAKSPHVFKGVYKIAKSPNPNSLYFKRLAVDYDLDNGEVLRAA